MTTLDVLANLQACRFLLIAGAPAAGKRRQEGAVRSLQRSAEISLMPADGALAPRLCTTTERLPPK
jgi:hypothetical protein